VTTDVAQLYSLGERIDTALMAGALSEAQTLMDCYLAGLNSQFQHLEQGCMPMLDDGKLQLLQQFKVLLAKVEQTKIQTEIELHNLSKAGRVAELYKKNASNA